MKIGVLLLVAAFALEVWERFRTFSLVSKRSEVRASFDQLRIAHESRRAETESYVGGFEDFRPPERARYTYRCDETATTFHCIASGNIDTDTFVDEWRLDETGTRTMLADDVFNDESYASRAWKRWLLAALGVTIAVITRYRPRRG